MYAVAILLLAAVSANAEPQYYMYPQQPINYFRTGVAPSLDSQPDARFFLGSLGAVTLTLATTTSTSVSTVTTTCTTTAAAVATCSPSGRRRRGLALNNNKGRALFYADDEEDAEEGSIFAPLKPEEHIAPAAESKREVRETSSPAVPFVVQPGFNAPESARGARFLVTFATSTSTTVSTSTYTVRLTAVCQSSTSFSSCAAV